MCDVRIFIYNLWCNRLIERSRLKKRLIRILRKTSGRSPDSGRGRAVTSRRKHQQTEEKLDLRYLCNTSILATGALQFESWANMTPARLVYTCRGGRENFGQSTCLHTGLFAQTTRSRNWAKSSKKFRNFSRMRELREALRNKSSLWVSFWKKLVEEWLWEAVWSIL